MPLMKPVDAAAELGISTKQLHALSADGSLPYINVGKADRPARRYDPIDIETFKAQRRITTCLSTSEPTPKRTATTSGLKVLDIQEILAAKLSAKQKSSSSNSARSPKS
ncbi:hypothetical protein AKG11_03445 [Shinella sp. SUS2]|nr:hypothetical protein AKG11_03445 [Shinella sp. SUS2]KOC77403.1 hypothetical protein AKG10_00915 [Shinella sp. GWS1]